MSFELSSLGKELIKNLEGGKESKIWNYIHPCTYHKSIGSLAPIVNKSLKFQKKNFKANDYFNLLYKPRCLTYLKTIDSLAPQAIKCFTNFRKSSQLPSTYNNQNKSYVLSIFLSVLG